MKISAFLLCIVLACLSIFIACDKDHGSGGAQPQSTGDNIAILARISGPDSTAGQYANFECRTKEAGTGIIARQWRVTGNGAIEGASNQKTVKVKVTGSGAFTVKLRVQSPDKVWSRWAAKTVAVNLPGFVITLDNLRSGQPISGSPASGSDATFTMSGFLAIYARYLITFDGDTGGLPAQVPVTITWSMSLADVFLWDVYGSNSGSMTVNVPLGGGSIGSSGTVLETGLFRPEISCTNTGVTAGTVTFSAPGVNPLTITVVRP